MKCTFEIGQKVKFNNKYGIAEGKVSEATIRITRESVRIEYLVELPRWKFVVVPQENLQAC